jgi:hypothetical protein
MLQSDSTFLPVVALQANEIPSYGYAQEPLGRSRHCLPRQWYSYKCRFAFDFPNLSGPYSLPTTNREAKSGGYNGSHPNAAKDGNTIEVLATRARSKPVGFVISGGARNGEDGNDGQDGRE